MTTTAERATVSCDRATSLHGQDPKEAKRPDLKRPLAALAIRELICLLAGTEDQIHRLRQEDANFDGRPDLLRRLLRQQNQVIGELRRRRAAAPSPERPD